MSVRSASQTFRRSFALILIAETLTILAVWLLLGSNVSGWIRDKATQLTQISQTVAASRDWSQIATVPKDRASRLFASYRKTLADATHLYFPNRTGVVFLSVLDHGDEYIIFSDDKPTNPLTNNGKADQWGVGAYSSGRTMTTPTPQTDATGTWLEAYTPILRNGKVVCLIGAQADSAPAADLQEMERRAFSLSIFPVILMSLIVAYILAGMFVEPMYIFRRIHEEARMPAPRPAEEHSDDHLSPREREVCDLAGQGLTNKEIAERLYVSEETVKTHVKSIRRKTGLNKVDLAVQAQARQIASLRQSATA